VSSNTAGPGLVKSAPKQDPNRGPPAPKAGRTVGQIQQNVVSTRCFGRPLLYRNETNGVRCSVFLLHYLPQPFGLTTSLSLPGVGLWTRGLLGEELLATTCEFEEGKLSITDKDRSVGG